mgnify:CR=1 FL=1
MRAMSTSPTHRAIDAVWRIESARVIAGLARMLRDLDLAEELAQDALVAALETWPRDGVPDNPGAWLMTTAKRRAIDRLQDEFEIEAELQFADNQDRRILIVQADEITTADLALDGVACLFEEGFDRQIK